MALVLFQERSAPVSSTRHRARRLPCLTLGVGLLAVWLGSSTALAAVPSVAPVVLRSFAHDTTAFTQGLLFANGRLYESTGLYGSSSLRWVELETGAVHSSVALPDTQFGEGLALVDQRLVQLTWKAGLAHVYDLATLEVQRSFDYSGEGWGLCYDGTRLVMSDGSSSLFFRDPTTFEMVGSVAVSRDGYSVRRLNELECVNGWVYANVWQTKQIVKIDPNTGEVVATIVVGDLLDAEQARAADVLNGIAYLPENQHFYITGKLWPKLFEVDFPAEAAPDPAPKARPVAGEGADAHSPPASDGPTSPAKDAVKPRSPAPPEQQKVTSGCHCATAGASRSTSARGAWGGALALALPLLWGRRVRRR